MSNAKFNLEKWEAELPKGKNIEKTKVSNGKFHTFKTEPNDPSLVVDSIESRPFRYLTPQMGPGAVVRTSGVAPGVRGSLEGPPLVGKIYAISSDSHSDEKEGTTDKGTWKCVSKNAQSTTMAKLDGSSTQNIRKHNMYARNSPGLFEYSNLQDYIFTEVAGGGKRKRSRTRKNRQSRKNRAISRRR
jgi:hypothetical protein